MASVSVAVLLMWTVFPSGNGQVTTMEYVDLKACSTAAAAIIAQRPAPGVAQNHVLCVERGTGPVVERRGEFGGKEALEACRAEIGFRNDTWEGIGSVPPRDSTGTERHIRAACHPDSVKNLAPSWLHLLRPEVRAIVDKIGEDKP